MNRPRYEIHFGDCLDVLRTLPDASVHCCVTSPPYWGLRDYGVDGQIGLEPTPEAYVTRMVDVFREVRRVLRDDGTCWINLGDSYAGGAVGRKDQGRLSSDDRPGVNPAPIITPTFQRTPPPGLKPKNLVGIPWRVAFALQADGWWLRQDIIWAKPNPMPESVRDRCTKAHEYVFLLSKAERYHYDAEAVKEATTEDYATKGRKRRPDSVLGIGFEIRGGLHSQPGALHRNRRSVWTITPKPFAGAHFATMPPDLVEPCIKAGCPDGGIVLDPFAGAGTTLLVANRLGRRAIGIELNPAYAAMARERIEADTNNTKLLDLVEPAP